MKLVEVIDQILIGKFALASAWKIERHLDSTLAIYMPQKSNYGTRLF